MIFSKQIPVFFIEKNKKIAENPIRVEPYNKINH